MKFGQNIEDRQQSPPGRRFYPLLILLSLLSILGLDYLAARRGDRAFFFPPRAVRPLLAESIRLFLYASGVSPDSVQEFQDKDGCPLIIIQLTPERYAGLEPKLEEELKDSNAVFDREQKEYEAWTSYSWRITREEEGPLSLLFSAPRTLPAAEKKPTEVIPTPPAGNLVAIIIDDMGNSLEALEEISDMQLPITISVLPLSAYAEETARMAYERGMEVMLHLPGESINNQEGNNYTAGLIRAGMSRMNIQEIVEASILRVPYIQGVNNHMGSKITQEESVMRPILETLKRHNLFFLDSRTTAASIAFDLARKMGLPSAYRNMFLDTTVGVEFTKQKIADLIRLSERTGRAIGIGHPFPETLQALSESLPFFAGRNVKAVFVSDIVRRAE